jgi:hypothetical protein
MGQPSDTSGNLNGRSFDSAQLPARDSEAACHRLSQATRNPKVSRRWVGVAE